MAARLFGSFQMESLSAERMRNSIFGAFAVSVISVSSLHGCFVDASRIFLSQQNSLIFGANSLFCRKHFPVLSGAILSDKPV